MKPRPGHYGAGFFVGEWPLRESIFRQAGYVEAMFEGSERDIEEIRAVILIHPETEGVVQLGEDGGKSGCIVGLKGMSQKNAMISPYLGFGFLKLSLTNIWGKG